MKSEPRIAFVIDALPALGGGEKVLFTALEAYPCAEVFTLIYNKKAFVHTPLARRKVHMSWLDELPFAHTHHRLFLPLMPSAIERFDLRAYDLVVCFSYAVAHGVTNQNGARHLSYTYTPMRYAWTDINLDGTRRRKNFLLDGFMQYFRKWDRRAASRVHQFAAISQAISQRIAQAYQRSATIIYPPVEVERFHSHSPREEYYLTVTRLVAHKRVDLLVQAFSKLNLPLVVIGDGPELPRLKRMANSAVHFLGYVSDEEVVKFMNKARGFVCAAEEDFGIAIVEAQAAGCPVLAYGRGGAAETVLDGVTGLLFDDQSADGVIEAVKRFEKYLPHFRTADLTQNAQRFNKERFLVEFQAFVEGTG
ncbi:MAG TPA: glycosyltransferase [Anaerolineales bacterium]|nr:glycosyltransferase [Anaerolineales bacterium]